jgi:hypothetical protein
MLRGELGVGSEFSLHLKGKKIFNKVIMIGSFRSVKPSILFNNKYAF